MSGHVVYSCACLNVKLHLANKYTIARHQDDRVQSFVRLEDPPLEGWQFDLGIGGVQAEYCALIKTTPVGSGSLWMTVKCMNCATGDVYSVARPSASAESLSAYPVDPHELFHAGDRVIIHANTIFGDELANARRRSDFSSSLGIVLNTTDPAAWLPVRDMPSVESVSASIPGDLFSQHSKLRKRLDDAINQVRTETQARIETFKREQLAKLEEDIARSKSESEVLWRRMLEVSRTVHEERHLERRLSQRSQTRDQDKGKGSKEPRDSGEASDKDGHVRFMEQQSQALSAQTSPAAVTAPAGASPSKASSSLMTSSSFRRGSFALDARVISASLKDKRFPEPTQSDIPPMRDHGHEDVALSDTDDMFQLDEEIESEGEYDAEVSDKQRKGKQVEEPRSAEWARKRSSFKYVGEFEDDETGLEAEPATGEDLSTSVSAYATSVPIAISHGDSRVDTGPTSEGNAVNPADRDPTKAESSLRQHDHETRTGNKRSSVADYDRFSLQDQEVSKLFPGYERRRQSIAVARAMSRPQLDSLIGQSLDTRRRYSSSARKNISQSVHEDWSDDEAGNGKMIPPHILAASTYTDETEELFGAVPRSGTWRKTFE